METRRLGRIGHQSSVLVYGAAALAAVDQETADASVQYALEAGINHIDTAASYGDAEVRLGPMMSTIRDQVFLATKTELRGAEESWAQINTSLERLQTDHVDLIQIHAVCDMDELDRVCGPGGSLESVIRAKEEGLATWVGITGHTHAAPSVHAEALRRHDFDSILTPLNPKLYSDPDFARDYDALVELITERDVALRTIKSAARRPWDDDQRDASTWYKPLTDQEHITAAIAWLLNGHPEINGLATAGEVKLLEKMVIAEQQRHELSVADAEAVLARVADYESPFARS